MEKQELEQLGLVSMHLVAGLDELNKQLHPKEGVAPLETYVAHAQVTAGLKALDGLFICCERCGLKQARSDVVWHDHRVLCRGCYDTLVPQ